MSFPLFDRVVLTGNKVLLRPTRAVDASTAFELIHGQREILRWLVWSGPASPRELEEFYGRWLVPRDGACNYLFAVLERSSGAFAGTISVRFAGHPSTGDLGYWLGLPFWGRGLGTEAIGLATWFAFHELAAAATCAWVFVGNLGSRRALEKNGYGLVRTRPRTGARPGSAEEEWYFGLTRSEWQRADSRIEPLGVVVEPPEPERIG